MSFVGNDSARDQICLRTDGIPSRRLLPSGIVASKRQSPDQQPEQASNEGDECECRDNPQVDEPGKCLSDNMSNLRTSDGETGDAHFEFGHLIEPVLLRIAARAKPDCSSFIKKLPALLGVNVNAA